jgi:hypothetical protein
MLVTAGTAILDEAGQLVNAEFLGLAAGGICGWLGILKWRTSPAFGGGVKDQSDIREATRQ